MQQNDEIGPAKGVDVFSIYPSNFALSFLKPFWSTPNQPPHYAGSYTVFLCLSGKGRLELDGRPYCIERGSVWITPSDAPAAWQEYSRPEPSVFQLPFSIQFVRDNRNDPYTRALLDFLNGKSSAVGFDPSLCDYSEFLKNRIGSKKQFCIESVLVSFLLDSVLTLAEGSTLLSDKEKILIYVNEHAREKITVSDLAKLLSISERSLFYFFSENFQTSPNDFINRIRMRSTAECLQKGLSVKEVSDMYKFSECTSFYRMFKKYFGITPTEYQRLIEVGKDTPNEYGGGYIDTCPPNA